MKYGTITLGQIEALINKVGGEDSVMRILSGAVEIVIKKHIIDCDADPFLPKGWKVEEHRKGGQVEWNATKVALYLSLNQQEGKVIEGNKLRLELASMPVMNAVVLDHLLAHPELIPEEWKGKLVFFWGTIYRNSGGRLCVRCLYWSGGAWRWSSRWLDGVWGSVAPAAVSQVST